MVVSVSNGGDGGELMPLLVDTWSLMALFGEDMWIQPQGNPQRFRAFQVDVSRVGQPHGSWVTRHGSAGNELRGTGQARHLVTSPPWAVRVWTWWFVRDRVNGNRGEAFP